jgi:hypothetical protein
VFAGISTQLDTLKKGDVQGRDLTQWTEQKIYYLNRKKLNIN